MFTTDFSTGLMELELMVLSFFLVSVIGLERQYHKKAAGYRTHVLVGLGVCAFTLVSAQGFAYVSGANTTYDPSRIAAQVVSGIGFIGGGVIFKGKNVIRGLTTAASVWVAASVGMACGAGMVALAAMVAVLYLVTIFVGGPLAAKVPTADRHRLVRVTYVDGHGVLRNILQETTEAGFSAEIESTMRTVTPEDQDNQVEVRVRFRGRRPIDSLIPTLNDLEGVLAVSTQKSSSRRDEEEDASDDED